MSIVWLPETNIRCLEEVTTPPSNSNSFRSDVEFLERSLELNFTDFAERFPSLNESDCLSGSDESESESRQSNDGGSEVDTKDYDDDEDDDDDDDDDSVEMDEEERIKISAQINADEDDVKFDDNADEDDVKFDDNADEDDLKRSEQEKEDAGDEKQRVVKNGDGRDEDGDGDEDVKEVNTNRYSHASGSVSSSAFDEDAAIASHNSMCEDSFEDDLDPRQGQASAAGLEGGEVPTKTDEDGVMAMKMQKLELERSRLIQEVEREEHHHHWYQTQLQSITDRLEGLNVTEASLSTNNSSGSNQALISSNNNNNNSNNNKVRRQLEFEAHKAEAATKEVTAHHNADQTVWRHQARMERIQDIDREMKGLQKPPTTPTIPTQTAAILEGEGEPSRETTTSSCPDGLIAPGMPLSRIYHGAWPIDKAAHMSGPSQVHSATATPPLQDLASVISFNSTNTNSSNNSNGQTNYIPPTAAPSSSSNTVKNTVMSTASCQPSNSSTSGGGGDDGSSSSKSSGSNVQPLGTKVEMVYSLLSMLGTHDKDDMSRTLFAMSQSQDSCLAMRQSGCLPLLLQLLHGSDKDSGLLGKTRGSKDARARASAALHNIVHCNHDDKRGRREARTLRLLEQIRAYCDQQRGDEDEEDETNGGGGSVAVNVPVSMDHHPGAAIAALMKLSFDEDYRHAICTLGGLQAIAELLEVDSGHGPGSDTDHDYNSTTVRRYACMSLTNLTFGDGKNKALLCSMRGPMRALTQQLQSTNEDLIQAAASVMRNLSWRADLASKKTLRELGGVTVLMKAAMTVKKETTLKSILSALWNLSSHCSENKAEICAVDGALQYLVSLLSYKSSSKTLAIVENGGGILRNVSSQIAIREDYRKILRKYGCLHILLNHLRSTSLTIVSNACGTLWNLSARCEEDQNALREMGAVSMLRNLVHSRHKMISSGSSAALRNLLSSVSNMSESTENGVEKITSSTSSTSSSSSSSSNQQQLFLSQKRKEGKNLLDPSERLENVRTCQMSSEPSQGCENDSRVHKTHRSPCSNASVTVVGMNSNPLLSCSESRGNSLQHSGNSGLNPSHRAVAESKDDDPRKHLTRRPMMPRVGSESVGKRVKSPSTQRVPRAGSQDSVGSTHSDISHDRRRAHHMLAKSSHLLNRRQGGSLERKDGPGAGGLVGYNRMKAGTDSHQLLSQQPGFEGGVLMSASLNNSSSSSSSSVQKQQHHQQHHHHHHHHPQPLSTPGGNGSSGPSTHNPKDSWINNTPAHGWNQHGSNTTTTTTTTTTRAPHQWLSRTQQSQPSQPNSRIVQYMQEVALLAGVETSMAPVPSSSALLSSSSSYSSVLSPAITTTSSSCFPHHYSQEQNLQQRTLLERLANSSLPTNGIDLSLLDHHHPAFNNLVTDDNYDQPVNYSLKYRDCGDNTPNTFLPLHPPYQNHTDNNNDIHNSYAAIFHPTNPSLTSSLPGGTSFKPNGANNTAMDKLTMSHSNLNDSLHTGRHSPQFSHHRLYNGANPNLYGGNGLGLPAMHSNSVSGGVTDPNNFSTPQPSRPPTMPDSVYNHFYTPQPFHRAMTANHSMPPVHSTGTPNHSMPPVHSTGTPNHNQQFNHHHLQQQSWYPHSSGKSNNPTFPNGQAASNSNTNPYLFFNQSSLPSSSLPSSSSSVAAAMTHPTTAPKFRGAGGNVGASGAYAETDLDSVMDQPTDFSLRYGEITEDGSNKNSSYQDQPINYSMRFHGNGGIEPSSSSSNTTTNPQTTSGGDGNTGSGVDGAGKGDEYSRKLEALRRFEDERHCVECKYQQEFRHGDSSNDDQVQTFCTEGTPYLSNATSLTDLRHAGKDEDEEEEDDDEEGNKDENGEEDKEMEEQHSGLYAYGNNSKDMTLLDSDKTMTGATCEDAACAGVSGDATAPSSSGSQVTDRLTGSTVVEASRHSMKAMHSSQNREENCEEIQKFHADDENEGALDQTKTYAEEGTPVCFSRVSSLSSLHSSDLRHSTVTGDEPGNHLDKDKVNLDCIEEAGTPEAMVNSVIEMKKTTAGSSNSGTTGTAGTSPGGTVGKNLNNNNSSNNMTTVRSTLGPGLKGQVSASKLRRSANCTDGGGDREGRETKTVTFDDNHQVEETPLMFSRSSSPESLSSFDTQSMHSSVVSEYSRRASEVVSPSDIPDSPSESMPSSPKRTHSPPHHRLKEFTSTPKQPPPHPIFGPSIKQTLDFSSSSGSLKTPSTVKADPFVNFAAFDEEDKPINFAMRTQELNLLPPVPFPPLSSSSNFGERDQTIKFSSFTGEENDDDPRIRHQPTITFSTFQKTVSQPHTAFTPNTHPHHQIMPTNSSFNNHHHHHHSLSSVPARFSSPRGSNRVPMLPPVIEHVAAETESISGKSEVPVVYAEEGTPPNFSETTSLSSITMDQEGMRDGSCGVTRPNNNVQGVLGSHGIMNADNSMRSGVQGLPIQPASSNTSSHQHLHHQLPPSSSGALGNQASSGPAGVDSITAGLKAVNIRNNEACDSVKRDQTLSAQSSGQEVTVPQDKYSGTENVCTNTTIASTMNEEPLPTQPPTNELTHQPPAPHAHHHNYLPSPAPSSPSPFNSPPAAPPRTSSLSQTSKGLPPTKLASSSSSSSPPSEKPSCLSMESLKQEDKDSSMSEVSEGEEDILAQCISSAMPTPNSSSRKMRKSSSDNALKKKSGIPTKTGPGDSPSSKTKSSTSSSTPSSSSNPVSSTASKPSPLASSSSGATPASVKSGSNQCPTPTQPSSHSKPPPSSTSSHKRSGASSSSHQRRHQQENSASSPVVATNSRGKSINSNVSTTPPATKSDRQSGKANDSTALATAKNTHSSAKNLDSTSSNNGSRNSASTTKVKNMAVVTPNKRPSNSQGKQLHQVERSDTPNTGQNVQAAPCQTRNNLCNVTTSSGPKMGLSAAAATNGNNPSVSLRSSDGGSDNTSHQLNRSVDNSARGCDTKDRGSSLPNSSAMRYDDFSQDTVCSYATEGTPLNFSASTSLSDLSVLTTGTNNRSPRKEGSRITADNVCDDVNKGNTATAVSDDAKSDNSSVCEESDEMLLSDLIQTGMPKSRYGAGGSARKSIPSSASSVPTCDANLNTGNGSSTGDGGKQACRDSNPSAFIPRMSNLSVVAPFPEFQMDTVKSYNVEGTPRNFSTATSLSDLTIDSTEGGGSFTGGGGKKGGGGGFSEGGGGGGKGNSIGRGGGGGDRNGNGGGGRGPGSDRQRCVNSSLRSGVLDYQKECGDHVTFSPPPNDTLHTYQVEGTPDSFSRRDSLSSLGIMDDESQGGDGRRQANNPYKSSGGQGVVDRDQESDSSQSIPKERHVIGQSSEDSSIAGDKGSDRPIKFAVEDTPVTFSRSSSLSSITSNDNNNQSLRGNDNENKKRKVNSTGKDQDAAAKNINDDSDSDEGGDCDPTPSEQLLLEQCIYAALPKSRLPMGEESARRHSRAKFYIQRNSPGFKKNLPKTVAGYPDQTKSGRLAKSASLDIPKYDEEHMTKSVDEDFNMNGSQSSIDDGKGGYDNLMTRSCSDTTELDFDYPPSHPRQSRYSAWKRQRHLSQEEIGHDNDSHCESLRHRSHSQDNESNWKSQKEISNKLSKVSGRRGEKCPPNSSWSSFHSQRPGSLDSLVRRESQLDGMGATVTGVKEVGVEKGGRERCEPSEDGQAPLDFAAKVREISNDSMAGLLAFRDDEDLDRVMFGNKLVGKAEKEAVGVNDKGLDGKSGNNSRDGNDGVGDDEDQTLVFDNGDEVDGGQDETLNNNGDEMEDVDNEGVTSRRFEDDKEVDGGNDRGITSEEEQQLLMDNIHLVVSEIHQTTKLSGSTVDEDMFIQLETISLVSNDYNSDSNSETSTSLTWNSETQSRIPTANNRNKVQRDTVGYLPPGSQPPCLSNCGARIVKPSAALTGEKPSSTAGDNLVENKGIRGGRKPLYPGMKAGNVKNMVASPAGSNNNNNGGRKVSGKTLNVAKVSPRPKQSTEESPKSAASTRSTNTAVGKGGASAAGRGRGIGISVPQRSASVGGLNGRISQSPRRPASGTNTTKPNSQQGQRSSSSGSSSPLVGQANRQTGSNNNNTTTNNNNNNIDARSRSKSSPRSNSTGGIMSRTAIGKQSSQEDNEWCRLSTNTTSSSPSENRGNKLEGGEVVMRKKKPSSNSSNSSTCQRHSSCSVGSEGEAGNRNSTGSISESWSKALDSFHFIVDDVQDGMAYKRIQAQRNSQDAPDALKRALKTPNKMSTPSEHQPNNQTGNGTKSVASAGTNLSAKKKTNTKGPCKTTSPSLIPSQKSSTQSGPNESGIQKTAVRPLTPVGGSRRSSSSSGSAIPTKSNSSPRTSEQSLNSVRKPNQISGPGTGTKRTPPMTKLVSGLKRDESNERSPSRDGSLVQNSSSSSPSSSSSSPSSRLPVGKSRSSSINKPSSLPPSGIRSKAATLPASSSLSLSAAKSKSVGGGISKSATYEKITSTAAVSTGDKKKSATTTSNKEKNSGLGGRKLTKAQTVVKSKLYIGRVKNSPGDEIRKGEVFELCDDSDERFDHSCDIVGGSKKNIYRNNADPSVSGLESVRTDLNSTSESIDSLDEDNNNATYHIDSSTFKREKRDRNLSDYELPNADETCRSMCPFDDSVGGAGGVSNLESTLLKIAGIEGSSIDRYGVITGSQTLYAFNNHHHVTTTTTTTNNSFHKGDNNDGKLLKQHEEKNATTKSKVAQGLKRLFGGGSGKLKDKDDKDHHGNGTGKSKNKKRSGKKTSKDKRCEEDNKEDVDNDSVCSSIMDKSSVSSCQSEGMSDEKSFAANRQGPVISLNTSAIGTNKIIANNGNLRHEHKSSPSAIVAPFNYSPPVSGPDSSSPLINSNHSNSSVLVIDMDSSSSGNATFSATSNVVDYGNYNYGNDVIEITASDEMSFPENREDVVFASTGNNKMVGGSTGDKPGVMKTKTEMLLARRKKSLLSTRSEDSVKSDNSSTGSSCVTDGSVNNSRKGDGVKNDNSACLVTTV